MTEAEKQPWQDEYLELRRQDPNFKELVDEQKSRRPKPKKEEDRLKAVAQLRIIEQQNANGEELTFTEIPDNVASPEQGDGGEHQNIPSPDNHSRLDGVAQELKGRPAEHGLRIIMNPESNFDFDFALGRQSSQNPGHAAEAAGPSQNVNFDAEFPDFDFDNNFDISELLDLEQ